MSGEHTPGPWATDHECAHESVIGPNGAMVADCAIFGMSKIFRERGGNNVANARLIAAAPDMLTALHQYANDLRYPPAADSIPRRLAMVEALIKKASGHD
jgi:hypothetical protein